jgi:hypothetical protein
LKYSKRNKSVIKPVKNIFFKDWGLGIGDWALFAKKIFERENIYFKKINPKKINT